MHVHTYVSTFLKHDAHKQLIQMRQVEGIFKSIKIIHQMKQKSNPQRYL